MIQLIIVSFRACNKCNKKDCLLGQSFFISINLSPIQLQRDRDRVASQGCLRDLAIFVDQDSGVAG